MINVLHISTVKSWRGGERQVKYLLEALKNSNSSKNYLLCDRDSELSKQIHSVSKEVHSGGFISWVKKINFLCNKYSIDIIHVHESKAHTLAYLSSKFFNSKKLVVTRRVMFPVKGKYSKLKYLYADAIICVSNAVKEEMNKIFIKNKLTIIPDLIEVNKFDNLKDNQVFTFLDSNKIKIGYVAALTVEKDHKTFLLTAKEVLKQREDIIFYIVGEGKLYSEIEQEIKMLNLMENVIMTGFIKDIDALILQLDILLFTSKNEGLGSTILDFFLAKKPVVATASLGVKDLVKNNETGILSEIGDYASLAQNLINLVESDYQTNQIINQAYAFVTENFNFEVLGNKHEDLYKKLLKD